MKRSYWDWQPILQANRTGFFPYTPATNLLFALSEALDMIAEEGRPAVFSRHDRLAAATRAAVREWGLEVVCADERNYSSSVTAVLLPDGADAAAFFRVALDRYNLALGVGLGRLAGRAFRIGHLGYVNELEMIAVLGGVQLALTASGVAADPRGLDAAIATFAGS